MTLYICLIVFYLLLALIFEKVKFTLARSLNLDKCILLGILLFPIFFTVAFRAETVGNDTIAYRHIYEVSQKKSLQEIIAQSPEPIFGIICHGVGSLGLSYLEFQIFIAFITYLFLFFYLKNHSHNYALSILVFMCILAYFRSMNIIRQMLVCLISLNVFDFYQCRKNIKYIASVLLLALIHRTAIILLFLLPFEQIRKLGVLAKIGFVIACVLSYTLADKFLSFSMFFLGKYDHFLESKYMLENGYLGTLAMLVFTSLCAFIEFYNKPLAKKDLIANKSQNSQILPRSRVLLYSYFLCFIVLCLGFAFGLANRMIIYFSLLFMETLSKPSHNRIILFTKVSTIILLITYYLFVMLLRNNWQGTIPYVLQI